MERDTGQDGGGTILAAWSGPRNLSTAMMYAFAQRTGCEAVDEPYFAAWLAATGADHPYRDETLLSQPNDAAEVARAVSRPAPSLRYLKLMAHHMLPGFPFPDGARHMHLLRHPARVIASYTRTRPDCTEEDLGFLAQERVFEAHPGPVVEAESVRADPEGTLRRLCEALGLDWEPAMLSWPAGPRAFDGAWAPAWYASVHASTGFAGAEGPPPEIDHPALPAALRIWERLRAHAV